MSMPFDVWGQRGWASVEVAGESHHAKAIRTVLGNAFKPSGTEVRIDVELVPEPGNRHDQHAVAVRVGKHLLGYLPREEAVRYSPVLSRLASHGWTPRVMARVWGSEWEDYEDHRRREFHGSVRLDLAEPHMLVPANAAPSSTHRLLPYGHAIQVTGEDQHLDTLSAWLRPEGECWVHATLHEVVQQTVRASRAVVEVRIDEERIGQLTPKMSGDMIPTIQHLAEQDTITAVRAVVKGNRIKTEVVLYALRAHELPDTWLDARTSTRQARAAAPAVAAPPTSSATTATPSSEPIPPPPTSFRFNPPPDWPPPPPGWTPPSGWQPDASWPAAPQGWSWWVASWD
ncbi:HIRAN domain-containing protein [Actinocatenispora sera]|nr:HIRAN domain-containing protein [Actinocatenispora sera]